MTSRSNPQRAGNDANLREIMRLRELADKHRRRAYDLRQSRDRWRREAMDWRRMA